MNRSGLHRFGACIEGAVGNFLFDAAVDAFAQQIEDQILTTVGEGRDAIDHPVDVSENAPIVGFSELLIFLLAQAVEAEIVHELFPAVVGNCPIGNFGRSEEHTSELQSLMRISYAVFCLKNKNI